MVFRKGGNAGDFFKKINNKLKKESRSLECIIKFGFNASAHIPPTEYKLQIPCKQASSFFIFKAIFSNWVSASISLNHLLQKLGRIW